MAMISVLQPEFYDTCFKLYSTNKLEVLTQDSERIGTMLLSMCDYLSSD